jgi:hypothetical protein
VQALNAAPVDEQHVGGLDGSLRSTARGPRTCNLVEQRLILFFRIPL